jgi:GTPase SAR1 family protein
VRVVLAGNKCDLPDRTVTKNAGEELARKWGCEFFETSAKENWNIHKLFEAALRTIVPKATERPIVEETLSVKKEEGERCCNVA